MLTVEDSINFCYSLFAQVSKNELTKRMRMRLKKGMWSFQSVLLSVIEPIRISIRLNGPLTRKTGRADISEEGAEYYEIYNFFQRQAIW